jgi:hypothetical protein
MGIHLRSEKKLMAEVLETSSLSLYLSRTSDDFECCGCSGARDTLNPLNAVTRTEYVFNDGLLSTVQVAFLSASTHGVFFFWSSRHSSATESTKKKTRSEFNSVP